MCRRQGVSEDGRTLKLEESEGREESRFLWTRESYRGLWLSWHGRKFTLSERHVFVLGLT